MKDTIADFCSDNLVAKMSKRFSQGRNEAKLLHLILLALCIIDIVISAVTFFFVDSLMSFVIFVGLVALLFPLFKLALLAQNGYLTIVSLERHYKNKVDTLADLQSVTQMK